MALYDLLSPKIPKKPLPQQQPAFLLEFSDSQRDTKHCSSHQIIIIFSRDFKYLHWTFWATLKKFFETKNKRYYKRLHHQNWAVWNRGQDVGDFEYSNK